MTILQNGDLYAKIVEIEPGRYDALDKEDNAIAYWLSEEEVSRLEQTISEGDKDYFDYLTQEDGVNGVWSDLARSSAGDMRPFKEAVEKMSQAARKTVRNR
jgi:hypothetical protein